MSRTDALRQLADAASYTADKFEADLGDARGKAAERRAAELTGEVASAEPRFEQVIMAILDERGTAARWRRQWLQAVRAQRKWN